MRAGQSAAWIRPGVLPPKTLTRRKLNCDVVSLVIPLRHSRGLAQVRNLDARAAETWFSSSPSCLAPMPSVGSGGDHERPDERALKLGKTIRVLHERLPTLLREPLPQDILSPQISLNLFPSTHPHLPTVTGRIPYAAALWTAPVAWGRMPVVGNIKLIIMSERMVRNGGSSSASSQEQRLGSERLVVRWKTCGKTKGKGIGGLYRGISATEARTGAVDKITEFLGGGPGEQDDKEFQGLFLFEFDEEGRIMNHVIEHAEEGGNWEKMPTVVNVTDWLLGRAWRKGEVGLPHGAVLNVCELEDNRRRRDRLLEQDSR